MGCLLSTGVSQPSLQKQKHHLADHKLEQLAELQACPHFIQSTAFLLAMVVMRPPVTCPERTLEESLFKRQAIDMCELWPPRGLSI